MALTPTEESQTRALLAQEAALLSLAGNEPTITSKLGAQKVNLSQLPAASTVADADLLLIRQGTTDKAMPASVIKSYAGVTVASQSQAETGTDNSTVMTPLRTAQAIAFQVSPSASVQGAFKSLSASATGTNANVSISADEIIVEDASNKYKTLRNVSLTVAGTSAGANGLDTGTIAASTWYSLWVIWNGTTTAGLMSLSATAPTLPSGYTHKARVGWIRTDGTGNKYPLSFQQYGRVVQYKPAAGSNLTACPALASGAQTLWTAVAIGNFAPPTAAAIIVGCNISSNPSANSDCALAPNTAYVNTVSGRPPIFSWAPINGIGQMSSGRLLLESSNIYYYGSNVNCGATCFGWEDNL